MASVDVLELAAGHLPPYCAPTSQFLHSLSAYFGVCIPTGLGFVSLLCGNLSILSWLCAQLPQIYKNFELKSASGLSVVFLITWLLGDLTNLLGALFTGQATWQAVVASYYVFIDVCLSLQYLWYNVLVPWVRQAKGYPDGSDSDDDDASSDLINSLSPINSSFHDNSTETTKDDEEEPSKTSETQPMTAPRLTDLCSEKSLIELVTEPGIDFRWPKLSSRKALYVATASSLLTQVAAAPMTSHGIGTSGYSPQVQFAGKIISWCSTAFYLGSRLPQIYQNWRRKSTTGLSPYLFMAAFSGNFFYSASMLTNPNLWHDFGPYGGHGWADENGSKRLSYIVSGAPFFLGAFGVLFQDAMIGAQILLYNDQQEKVVKVRDRQGVGRWRRVSGWMRGWIPSMQRERIVDLSESQRLLSQSREFDRHSRHSQYGGI